MNEYLLRTYHQIIISLVNKAVSHYSESKGFVRPLVKTKLVDFGVFTHVGFISGHNDTKGIVGQYLIIFSRDFSGIGLTRCLLQDFGVFSKFNFFKNRKINPNSW